MFIHRLSLLAAALTIPAFAQSTDAPGVILIDQQRAISLGIGPGDRPGFAEQQLPHGSKEPRRHSPAPLSCKRLETWCCTRGSRAIMERTEQNCFPFESQIQP